MASSDSLGDCDDQCVGEADAHKEVARPEVKDRVDACLAGIVVGLARNRGCMSWVSEGFGSSPRWLRS